MFAIVITKTQWMKLVNAAQTGRHANYNEKSIVTIKSKQTETPPDGQTPIAVNQLSSA